MEYKQIFGIDTVGKNGYMLENSWFYSYPKHCHVFYEMLLYQPFEGYITINETDFRVLAPTAILITPAVFHSIHVEGKPVRYKKVMFSGDIVKKDILKYLEHSLYYADVDPLFSLLTDRLFTMENEEFTVPVLQTLLIEMIGKGTPVPSERTKKSIRLIADAIQIINSDFTSELSLETVARQLNVSKQYLSAQFTQKTDKTFTAYLNFIRLRCAAALLTESELSVSEICYRCGYNNLSYFLRSFKRRFGVSPGQFKQ